jgi:putative two-component system response regulator
MSEAGNEQNVSRVLLVDDTPTNLAVLKETLAPEGYKLAFANSGEKALEIASQLTPELILLDVMIPGIDGLETCRQLKANSKTKEIPVIFITAKKETEDIVAGFKVGGVDYITKPFQQEEVCARVKTHLELVRLRKSVEEQYNRVREVLENTLSGSVGLLTEILSSFDPNLFEHASRLKELAHRISGSLKVKNAWELDLAAMLAPIGYVSIPREIIAKTKEGKNLSQNEREILAGVYESGSQILSRIPHLKQVSKIVLYLGKYYEGEGFPEDSISKKDIPYGARLLKLLGEMLKLEKNGKGRLEALDSLRIPKGRYDPEILDNIYKLFELEKTDKRNGEQSISVSVKELKIGHILSRSVLSLDGENLLAEGTKLSKMKLNLLINHSKLSGLKEPIYIRDLNPEL